MLQDAPVYQKEVSPSLVSKRYLIELTATAQYAIDFHSCGTMAIVYMNEGLERLLLEVPSPGRATAFEGWLHMQLLSVEGYYNAL